MTTKINMVSFDVQQTRPNQMRGVYRHNERVDEHHKNPNIIQSQSHNNFHFKQCVDDNGNPITYEQAYKSLIDKGTIVERGLQANATRLTNLIFDVNSDYFHQNGGYQFAKQYFADAYQLACDMAGGEQYILSAVVHADEISLEATERLGKAYYKKNKDGTKEIDIPKTIAKGKPVWHYHMHVTTVPVTEKVIKFRKGHERAGEVKEIIPQVSHSKKWGGLEYIATGDIDSKGKPIMERVTGYSKAWDRYAHHMQAKGYEVERGVKDSDRVKQTQEQYNAGKEKERLERELKAVKQPLEGAIALEQRINAFADAVTEHTTLTGKTITTIKLEGKKEVVALPVINAAKDRHRMRNAKNKAVADKETAETARDNAINEKAKVLQEIADREKALAEEQQKLQEQLDQNALDTAEISKTKENTKKALSEANQLKHQQENLNELFQMEIQKHSNTKDNRDHWYNKTMSQDKTIETLNIKLKKKDEHIAELKQDLSEAYLAIKAMAQAVKSLLHDQIYKIANIRPEQQRLIQAIANYGATWSKKLGYVDISNEINSGYGLSNGIKKHVDELTPTPVKKKSYDHERD